MLTGPKFADSQQTPVHPFTAILPLNSLLLASEYALLKGYIYSLLAYLCVRHPKASH